ncbi:restriction endonuclease subunit S [Dialister hominis]|jgi:type I restriction enzyme S subunit|uniref:restriction endonuclease subunit S n=1 Tax=Dialister hominis TaxID=2582419 RepID=UPI003AF198E5
MEYKLLSEVSVYRKDRIGSDKVNKENYISTENMLSNRGGVENATTVASAKSFPAYKKGDILLSNIRPYFKKIWYATQEGGCSNDVLVVKAGKTVDSKFLYYVLSDNNFFNYSTVTAKGTKMPRGSQNAIMKYWVPNLDLPTQKKIADILSSYDELIKANNERIELLEQTVQELYKEWFVRFRFPGYENAKFEEGIPEGWSYVRFGKAIDIIDGDRGVNYPKQEEFYPEGDCLFLNAGNVTTKGFDFSSCAYITKEKDAILRKGKVQHGDVLLTTRGTVGNVAFYNETMTFSEMRINSGMVILRNLGVVSPEYIYTSLRHEYLQKLMTMYASGSAQPQLPIKDMKRMKIIKSDTKTMERFTEMSADIYNQISLLIMKNQTLAKQRDMLLPRLMSGKLEV